MRLKNLFTAPLSIGPVEIQPGAEADVISVNDALIAAWLAAGLIADVTPPAPPAPPVLPPTPVDPPASPKKSDK